MKILVLGAGGMAGHVVTLYLREHGYMVDTVSAIHKLDKNTKLIDVANIAKLQQFLAKNKYQAVINCIGLLVKPSQERPDLAVYLNAFLPQFLANLYQRRATKVIHLSTDCVFSGKHSPYKESDTLDTSDHFYDRSKALGEIINDKDLTLRMSIIGPDMRKDGISLVNWWFGQRGEIGGFDKVIWSGATTIELAKTIKAALEQNLSGVYHLTPGTGISKFKLLQLFGQVFERDDISLKPKSDVVMKRVLLNTRRDFKFKVADYPTMIAEMKQWIDAHPQLYPHYKKYTDAKS